MNMELSSSLINTGLIQESKAPKQSRIRSEITGWIKFLSLLVLAYFIIGNTVGLTVVSGNSMNSTISSGSLLLINKMSTYFSKPNFGDVVIVHESGYDIIKRVIGVSGDKVAIKNGIVYVNESPLPEIYTLGKAHDMPEVKVEIGKVFIMGDNRTPGESLDSRDPTIGQVSAKRIKGYALFSIKPAYRIMKPIKI